MKVIGKKKKILKNAKKKYKRIYIYKYNITFDPPRSFSKSDFIIIKNFLERKLVIGLEIT